MNNIPQSNLTISSMMSPQNKNPSMAEIMDFKLDLLKTSRYPSHVMLMKLKDTLPELPPQFERQFPTANKYFKKCTQNVVNLKVKQKLPKYSFEPLNVKQKVFAEKVPMYDKYQLKQANIDKEPTMSTQVMPYKVD